VIRAVLDTNIILQALISPPWSTSARVTDALLDGKFAWAYSIQTDAELFHVLQLPWVRGLHKLDDDAVLAFVIDLSYHGDQFDVTDDISPALTRDPTDTKFLALAAASRSDYLVTNDRRHLLPLKRFGDTRIVLPGEFLRELGSPAA
jgi:putative PIN family toxin of toxin-antitoxin system